jgi:hypothetical protein
LDEHNRQGRDCHQQMPRRRRVDEVKDRWHSQGNRDPRMPDALEHHINSVARLHLPASFNERRVDALPSLLFRGVQMGQEMAKFNAISRFQQSHPWQDAILGRIPAKGVNPKVLSEARLILLLTSSLQI